MPNWKKLIVSGSDAALNSLNVTTALTASGLIYPTADNGEESFIQTDGNGNLSLQYVKTIYEEIVNGEATNLVKGTPVYVSGSVGAAAKVFRADPTNPSKMPAVYISADTLAPAETGRGIALGLIKGVDTTGYPAGTEIYLAAGGGWTSTRPTGSTIVQVLGYVTKEGAGGQGVVLNPGPATLPNLPSGSVWVGNSNSVPVAVLTSSLSVASASYAQTASFLPVGTYNITSSWATNAITSSYPISVTGSTLFSTSPSVGTGFTDNNSVFLGTDAADSAAGARYSVFIGNSAGKSATAAQYSNFIGLSAGEDAESAAYSNFLGSNAGNSATNANNSNFLGSNAGNSATNANNSNFLGDSAGANAPNASDSNFLGKLAGNQADDAVYSNFLGNSAGSRADNASYSNFLGVEAGASATDANNSNFLGTKAGKGADKAAYSNFLGGGVGENAVSASYSTLIGYQVGYNSAGLNTTSIGSNNIIIGTNITLPDQSKDSINLGAIIFATGSYSTITGNPFSGSIAPSVGKVGINKVTPLYNLDVSGSGNFSNNLTVTGSTYLTGLTTTSQTDVLTYNSTTGQVFFTASSAIGGGGGGSTVKAGSGSAASFGGSPLTSSITFGSAFSDNLYAVTITGEDARSWTIQSKTSAGFTINSNSSVGLTGPVYWMATPFGS